jgi:hypothetical protein
VTKKKSFIPLAPRSIDTDDFTGSCGHHRFPLLRAINNALYMRSQGITDRTSGALSPASSLSTLVAVLACSYYFL